MEAISVQQHNANKELAQKATPCAVARELNARGRTGRGGKPWHSYVVSRILGAAK